MRNDWIFDAVQAEVAYRTEELYKSWPAAQKRRRWRLGRRVPEVQVPEQRRPSRDEVALSEARAR
ncbi:hypothetical protein LWP59_29425 [Amycolatopsis acidiphila]|uniref:Uncharacterized protein n=1 Tax=Amycolatopsis acidiphila TaxID=715473 RepID=A0A558A7K4_9PSEU|nr:hypothetical protein [Amycolatopsis acidiphila]TVT20235.1 hypothetical protein FNH06_21635 [Amycolatopsis acidiphila]UIJ58214.1 hypothetical protein LWP59_29425 [Amycolatopsis acidiphila]GHG69369.1 hypothetical protein GCM10017788_29580 [Amycolatopsis acidiphila]